MSFYDLVRTAIVIRRQRGVYATARFLKSHGICIEERRKLLAEMSK